MSSSLQMNKLYDLTGLVALVTGGGTGTLSPLIRTLLVLLLIRYRHWFDDFQGIRSEWSQGLHHWKAKGSTRQSCQRLQWHYYTVRTIIFSVPHKDHANRIFASLSMDATDKSSILKARDIIAEKEGRLHILVNKLVTNVTSPYASILICHAVLAKLAPSLDS